MTTLLTIKPTTSDLIIARYVAHHTNATAEVVARGLTWGADEKVLLGVAIAAWIASRGQGEHLRRAGNHVLLVTVLTAAVPHALKALVDQTRPDRETVIGHLNGVSISGKPNDSFPSGHALHMGALASVAGTLPGTPRRAVQALAVGLSLTRILVLAHWTSDVVVGFAAGAVLERMTRLFTGFPLHDRGTRERCRRRSQ